jgi:hypothetical protein
LVGSGDTTGDNGSYTGTLSVSGASSFSVLVVQNASADLTVSSAESPSWTLDLLNASFEASGTLTCGPIDAFNSALVGTVTATSWTFTGGSYSGTGTSSGNVTFNGTSILSGSSLTVAGTSEFLNCTFTGAVTLTSTGVATFDSASWRSFVDNGGVLGSTIVLVIGGFLGGVVNGAVINNPAATISLSLNGTGASATWVQGGNAYAVTGQANNTIATLENAGAEKNDTLYIAYTGANTSGTSFKIGSQAGATLATLTQPGQFAVLLFNGVNWQLELLGGPANAESTIFVPNDAGTPIEAYTNAFCQTGIGPVSVSFIAVNGGPVGGTYEVSDYNMNAATNHITVTPPAGMQLEDPNNPGAYAAAGASIVMNINGQSARWRYDGTGKFKLVATAP